jgi:hypothetical protein
MTGTVDSDVLHAVMLEHLSVGGEPVGEVDTDRPVPDQPEVVVVVLHLVEDLARQR